MNAKIGLVEIEWDKNCLNDLDKAKTRHKLLPTKWNPKIAREGAWREFIEQGRARMGNTK